GLERHLGGEDRVRKGAQFAGARIEGIEARVDPAVARIKGRALRRALRGVAARRKREESRKSGEASREATNQQGPEAKPHERPSLTGDRYHAKGLSIFRKVGPGGAAGFNHGRSEPGAA